MRSLLFVAFFLFMMYKCPKLAGFLVAAMFVAAFPEVVILLIIVGVVIVCAKVQPAAST